MKKDKNRYANILLVNLFLASNALFACCQRAETLAMGTGSSTPSRASSATSASGLSKNQRPLIPSVSSSVHQSSLSINIPPTENERSRRTTFPNTGSNTSMNLPRIQPDCQSISSCGSWTSARSNQEAIVEAQEENEETNPVTREPVVGLNTNQGHITDNQNEMQEGNKCADIAKAIGTVVGGVVTVGTVSYVGTKIYNSLTQVANNTLPRDFEDSISSHASNDNFINDSFGNLMLNDSR